MIKLFVSDIDGTIYDHTVGVPSANVEAVLELQTKAVKIVLASGRAIPAMMEIANKLKLKENNGYIIASNGAEVYDLSKNVYIHQELIPVDIVREMYLFSLKHNLFFSCVQNEELYYSNYDQALEHTNYHGTFKIKHIKQSDDITVNSSKCSIHIEINENSENMNRFVQHFKHKVSIERLMPSYMDVQSIGQSKRIGLEKLCDYLSIDLKDVAAIGDGTNDQSMLEVVGVSASLLNSNEQILSIVDHIMPSAKDAGVAHFARLIINQIQEN